MGASATCGAAVLRAGDKRPAQRATVWWVSCLLAGAMIPRVGVGAPTDAGRRPDAAAAQGGNTMSRRQFLTFVRGSVAFGATLALLPNCTTAALTARPVAQTSSPAHDQPPLRIGELKHLTERQLLPLTLWLGTPPDERSGGSDWAAEIERRKGVLNTCLLLLATRGADVPAHFFDHPQSGRVSGGMRLIVTDTQDPWVREQFPALSLDAGFGSASAAHLTLARGSSPDSQRPRIDATVALFFDRAVAIEPGFPEVPAATALARQLDGALLVALAAAFDDRTRSGDSPTPTAVARAAQRAAQSFADQKLAAARRADSPAAIKVWEGATRREAAAPLDQRPFAFITVER